MKGFISIFVVLLLGGCASTYKTLPDGYSGPTATVEDSYTVASGSKVDFFYVEKLDGHDIENSREKSLASNRGKGFSMSPVPFSRSVQALKPVSLFIVGRTQHAAPILALTHAEFQVKGIVDFVPKPDGLYVVKGELGDDRSAVWVEDSHTREVVSKKIEINGSAKLGIFEK